MKFNFNYKEFLQSKHSIRLVIALAVVAVILIICADFSPEPEYETISQESEYSYTSYYTSYLEEKIYYMVKAITGEASPEVVITLNSGETYVYAQNVKEDIDGDKKESEEEYIIVENSNGDEETVLVTQYEPDIKGVVVVSSFGDDAVVREKIINAVQTALDLASNKVCVVSKG